jgi:hypothetical protein
LADIIFLIVAYLYAWKIGSMDVHDSFETWFAYDRGNGEQMTMTGWWYSFIGLPLYQFVFFRWIWRVILWWRFLWQFSRLNLRLLPTHPDRAGGLGILEMGQSSFVFLVFPMSAILAANLADEKIREVLTLASFTPTIAVYLVLSLLFVVGPLLIFASKLIRAKRRGLVEYGDLADVLFGAFQEK